MKYFRKHQVVNQAIKRPNNFMREDTFILIITSSYSAVQFDTAQTINVPRTAEVRGPCSPTC